MKPSPILFFLVLFTSSVQSQVFVNKNATGANNGSTWQNAYTNLDSALLKTSSGQIWVAAGTYIPSILRKTTSNKKYATFSITKKIALYGGFKGVEASLDQRNFIDNPTILSGDILKQGYDFDNTPEIISITGDQIDSTTILDGFTITKAYWTNGFDYTMGAVHIGTSGAPVIRNCIIKENVGFTGGGIYIVGDIYARPLIINNTITDNTAYEGAGIALEYVSARIINNTIKRNSCKSGSTHLSGGGIQIKAYASPYIFGNLIDSNYAGTQGGGIANESNYSCTISNNIISNNTSDIGGGFYFDYQTIFTGNLIFRNHAVSKGGGGYINSSFGTKCINNTIVNNSTDYECAALKVVDANISFINTIIYNNPTFYTSPILIGNLNNGFAYPTFDYCDIENGKDGFSYTGYISKDSMWRMGNITSNPMFADTANGNYHLTNQSPCVNTGNPDTSGLSLPATDISGNIRIAGGRIDIGSYELNTEINFKKNISVAEGGSGTTTNAKFNIYLNQTSATAVTVNYTTKNLSAIAGSDYIAKSGVITFSPGITNKAINIVITGDDSIESNERFSVVLNNPSNATLGSFDSATCIIKNDDPSLVKDIVSDKNTVTKTTIKAYPNPAKNILTIEGLTARETLISIIDITGKNVFKASSVNNYYTINLKSLVAGTYFLRIESASENAKVFKFIKE